MNEILEKFLLKYNKYKKIEIHLDNKLVNKEVECRFEIDYQITDILKKLNSLQIFNVLSLLPESTMIISSAHEIDSKHSLIECSSFLVIIIAEIFNLINSWFG